MSRIYSTNGADKGAQGAALPKYRQHGAGQGAKAEPAATEASRRKNVCANAHCAATDGALAVGRSQARARPALGPRDSMVNITANKCASSKLPRPSSRSWRTCPSQSRTMARAQQSRDCEGAKCLQLPCTVRACCASDLHGMHVQNDSVKKLILPLKSALSAFSYGADARPYLLFVCGLICPVIYATARLSVSASGP